MPLVANPSDEPAYRIDAKGLFYQRVRPGSRTPVSGYRCLGRVLEITQHPRVKTWIRVHIERISTPPVAREVTILAADLVDERGGGAEPAPEVSPQRAGQVQTYPGWLT